jgi:glycosyltransferase involved in cell wall biosynthesis
MRYCFFTTGNWEGNASLVRVRELGREMIERGVEVSYVVDDIPYNHANINVHPKAQVAFVERPDHRGQFKRRRAALASLRPDLVHVLNPYVKAILSLAFTRWRLVIDWDEWPARRARRGLEGLTEWWMGRWMRRRASLVVVASRYMHNDLKTRLGIDSVYIPYATYLRPQADGPSPFDRPTAVYMGNLYDSYDHDVIFEAARLLKARGLTPPIRIMGNGPEEQKWRAFVAEHGLDNVALPGFVSGEALWRSLRHAHVLLFPIRPSVVNLSRCPSKTFAYAQARRPVVTSRVGEIEAVLSDRAQYVDCTPQAFADAIERAVGAPALPDVDYEVERHNWSARTDDLLRALDHAPRA